MVRKWLELDDGDEGSSFLLLLLCFLLRFTNEALRRVGGAGEVGEGGGDRESPREECERVGDRIEGDGGGKSTDANSGLELSVAFSTSSLSTPSLDKAGPASGEERRGLVGIAVCRRFMGGCC